MRRPAPCWGPPFSPCAAWSQVAVPAVQAVLRQWFAQWGLPGALRVDNGAPWGAAGRDFPPALALWLLGLGIDLVWNRPRQSTDNAVIERDHGVCQRWVEAHTCPDLPSLQARLDWAVRTQRERYPACAGRSRLAAYPALATGGRPYDPAREGAQWQVRRVWRWLGAQIWSRRVDQVGRISLANRAVGVGRAWAGQEVTVRLVVRGGRPHWRICAADGALLHHRPAPELSQRRIRTLDVSRRRPGYRQRAKARAQLQV